MTGRQLNLCRQKLSNKAIFMGHKLLEFAKTKTMNFWLKGYAIEKVETILQYTHSISAQNEFNGILQKLFQFGKKTK